jgi:hypothetical protein
MRILLLSRSSPLSFRPQRFPAANSLEPLVCPPAISYSLAGARLNNIEEFMMVRAVAVLAIAGLCGLFSLSANAANSDQAAALKKASADCRAQVKEYAKYNATSWYARHKMVKKCLKGVPWRQS